MSFLSKFADTIGLGVSEEAKRAEARENVRRRVAVEGGDVRRALAEFDAGGPLPVASPQPWREPPRDMGPDAAQVDRDAKHWQAKLAEWLERYPNCHPTWRQAAERALAFAERFGRQAAFERWTATALFSVDNIQVDRPAFVGVAFRIDMQNLADVTIAPDAMRARFRRLETPALNVNGPPAPAVSVVGEPVMINRPADNLVGEVIWALTPPPAPPPRPDAITFDLGALGVGRYAGPGLIEIRPDAAKPLVYRLDTPDVLKLLDMLTSDPWSAKK